VPINLKQFTTVPNAGDVFSSLIVSHILQDEVASSAKTARTSRT
jgi:hypothetical protein